MNTCLKCDKLVLFFVAIFRSLTSDLDEVIMALGGNVQLHLVFGDITNETTDVVVNTTDFTNFHNGIKGCIKQVYVSPNDLNHGDIFVSQSGQFPCKAFFHVCGERDESLIEELVSNIINQCEKSGFESVAIPAICTGMYINVSLQSSKEYKLVKEAFKMTARQTVIKIERLQNIHLRRAYEAQKKHIAFKNATLGGESENTLFHGTSHENCNSIMNNGFNRSFAGQNATAYGEGTYFAVNASYSAQSTYSKPGADGSQLMFVVRVLTGVYAQGQKGMKVPPLRNAQQPNERFDSVVDDINNPSMYVVFHDDQAYPDYLITFK
uniref:Poly [ADP-ribose] polymerase n=1 Tax=Oryzias melastigma TaxID=30732 RepID=A0A3B3CCN9_ORYME